MDSVQTKLKKKNENATNLFVCMTLTTFIQTYDQLRWQSQRISIQVVSFMTSSRFLKSVVFTTIIIYKSFLVLAHARTLKTSQGGIYLPNMKNRITKNRREISKRLQKFSNALLSSVRLFTTLAISPFSKGRL